MTRKTIAVIGGTGKSGKYVIEQLLARGFQVRALLRDVSKFGGHRPLIDVVKGDVCDDAVLAMLMQGADAVISTLGQPHGGTPIFSKATRHILRALAQTGLRRYIVVTGLSIDIAGDAKGERTRQLSAFMRTSYPAVIADKQQEYALLAESRVDWTLVRLPLIEQTAQRSGVVVDEKDCPGERISATDLADFLIDQVDDVRYIRKTPFVASRV